MAEPKCETCPMRLKAEKNPKALMSRLWNGTQAGARVGRLIKNRLQSKPVKPIQHQPKQKALHQQSYARLFDS